MTDSVGDTVNITVVGEFVTSYSATGLPPGVTISGAGIITGKPTTSGEYTPEVNGTGPGGTAKAPFTWTVLPATTVTKPARQETELDEPVSLAVTGTSVTSWEAFGLPSGLHINAVTGRITGTAFSSGTFTPRIVGHGASGTAEAGFEWVISAAKHTPSGERLYESVPSVFAYDEETGWFGKFLCDALMSMFQDLDLIVRDTPAGIHPITQQPAPGMKAHPGWSAIVDPVVCPVAWLDWCAALYGVEPEKNAPEGAQRAQIKELPPQKRGGIEAMVKAAEATLTGLKRVGVIEQVEGHSYKILVTTTAAETPSKQKTEEALLAQKPGGVVMVYQIGVTWAEATKKWSEVATGVKWNTVETGEV
jgi:hypothetical protein